MLLILIMVVALAIRLYKLGEWSFWGDEMITVVRAMGKSTAEPLPRLSVWLTSTSFTLWGIGEWSARISSAVIGALTVPVLYFGTRRMFDATTGLLAAALLAISTWHIYWSQNARFYIALLLFYTLAMFFFHFGLERDRPWYFIIALGFLGLALLESLTAAFLIPIVFLYLVLVKLLPMEKPKGLRWRNVLLFFGPLVAGGFFILWRYIQSVETWRSTFWFFDFAFLNNSPFWILAGVVYYLGIPLVVMSFFGGLSLLFQKDRRALLLILGAAVPLLSIMLISLVQYTANRYVFVVTTSVVILAAVAVRELIKKVAPGSKLAVAGAVLILIAAPMSENLMYYGYQNGNRDDWKGAFAWLKAHKQPGDVVITVHRDLADFYLQESTMGVQRLDIKQLAGDGRRLWFVLDLTAPTKAPDLVNWFQRNGRQMASMDISVHARVYPMRIYLYDPAWDSSAGTR